MKNKKIVVFIILFLAIILLSCKCFAKDLDKINKYYITVDPRNDGTLDLTYHIEWEVLDSDLDGPLSWVKVGIPNSSVTNLDALSSNIKKISYYYSNGDYIRIDFDKSYYAGEVVSFDFSFCQSYMYTIKNNTCTYSFTPGWFNDLNVEEICVFWNGENVKNRSTAKKNSDGYYQWTKSLYHGEKMKVEVSYNVNDFYNLDMNKQVGNAPKSSNTSIDNTWLIVCVIIIIIVAVISPITSAGTGYRRHSGYGYGYGHDRYSHHSHHSSCACASSCACVRSCACACACAGGGRAGCSKKDFYGVTIRTKQFNRIIKEK